MFNLHILIVMLHLTHVYLFVMVPHGKESTKVRITQKIGKKYQKMNISPNERHTQTHESLIETF